MQLLRELFQGTVEYQAWGWNAITVSSIIAIALTGLQYKWGVWKQYQTIRDTGSIEAISAVWHGYFTILLITIGIYGWRHNSIAMVLNSVLATGHFLVFRAVLKRQEISGREKMILILATCIPIAMLLLPWTEAILLIANVVSIGSLALQAWTIWKKKNAGAVETDLIFIYLVAIVFWVVYSYALGILAMKIVMTIILIVFSLTYWLCRFKFPARQPAS